MALSLAKKLIILFIAVPSIVTPIATKLSKKKEIITSNHNSKDLLTSAKEKKQDFPKYCRLILSSIDLKFEVLLCFDLDKENRLNAQQRKYSASFFLLDKTNDTYRLEKIHGLLSTLKKDIRKSEHYSWYSEIIPFKLEEIRRTNWQAFQYKEEGSLYEEDRQLIGSPFMIKFRELYSREPKEGFALPYWDTEFLKRRYTNGLDGHAVLFGTDLITGAFTKSPFTWGNQRQEKDFNDLEPILTDPFDERLLELKQNSKYQIILEEEDKYWNSGGFYKENGFIREFHPSKVFSCQPLSNLFEGKIQLNCFSH